MCSSSCPRRRRSRCWRRPWSRWSAAAAAPRSTGCPAITATSSAIARWRVPWAASSLSSGCSRPGSPAGELGERRARLDAERQRAADPVLARRALVERTTLAAVRRHRPRLFEGRVKLFLPGVEWQRSGVSALRWCTLAAHAETYFGPDSAGGSDMLLEGHASAFAALFRSAYGEPQ